MKKPLALVCLGVWLVVACCRAGPTATPQSGTTAQDQQVYELYRQYMEALNKQRQQAGLPPLTVRSYENFRQTPGTD